jgi:hypothetical protein
MKPRLGWTRDPAFHLITLATVVLATALAVHSRAWGGRLGGEVSHPPACHACSLCPQDVAAARDAFLIQTGSIVPDDGSE